MAVLFCRYGTAASRFVGFCNAETRSLRELAQASVQQGCDPNLECSGGSDWCGIGAVGTPIRRGSRAMFRGPGHHGRKGQLADRQNTVAGADRNRCQRAARWTLQHRPSCAVKLTPMGRTEQRRSVPGTDRGSSVGARGRVSDELPRHGLCHNVAGDNDSGTDWHLRLLYLDSVHRGGG